MDQDFKDILKKSSLLFSCYLDSNLTSPEEAWDKIEKCSNELHLRFPMLKKLNKHQLNKQISFIILLYLFFLRRNQGVSKETITNELINNQLEIPFSLEYCKILIKIFYFLEKKSREAQFPFVPIYITGNPYPSSKFQHCNEPTKNKYFDIVKESIKDTKEFLQSIGKL